MDSGYYAACAGLVARTEALDTIASNLANSSTNGFRGEQNVFGSVLANAHGQQQLSGLNRAENTYGVLSKTQLDLSQGTIFPTGNPLDVAIEGSGFFKVQTAHGVAYTRNGGFAVSAKGQLVTSGGDAVLGETGPISVPPGTLSVSPDGTISSNGAIAGRLKLVDFALGTAVTSRGSGFYNAPSTAEIPAPASRLRQGALENSNINPVTGVVELISAQRSAEAMRHVLSMLDSEMDKTAAQDLPKVS